MINAAWQTLPLRKLLKKSTTTIELKPNVQYKEITVRLWGKGVVLRGMLSGAEIKGTRRFLAREGQVILSRIDARNGALGIVPQFLNGAVVSNDFPLFDVDPSILNPHFLNWICKTPAFVDLCKKASEGTTNRVRLQEDRFLSMDISLPDLIEQERIVERINRLVFKVNEARELKRNTSAELDYFMKSVVASTFENVDKSLWRPLGECGEFVNGKAFKPHEWSSEGLPIVRIQNLNNPSAQFNYCAFEVPSKFLIGSGDLLLSWSGTPGTSFGAHIWNRGKAVLNQHIFKVLFDESKISKYYFRYAINFKLDEMISKAHGGVGLQHITKGKLEQILIPLPDFMKQEQIVAELDLIWNKTKKLKELQSLTSLELDSLPPSILDKAFRGEL